MKLKSTGKGRRRRGGFRGPITGAALLAVPFLGFYPSASLALPPDPQRPFVATDCDGAMARLREALAGNPLISKTEMAEVKALARAQAERLCGTDTVKEMLAGFGDKAARAAKGDCSSDRSD